MRSLIIAAACLVIPAALVSPVHAQQTPRAAMTQFLASWKKADFSGMAKASQRHQKATATDLKNFFGVKKLTSFQIVKEQKATPVMSRVTAKITYKFGDKPQTHSITANVIREDASGNPSPSGSWGVNYLSALREE